MKQKRIWLVTGDPGSGKTTMISKILFAVRSEGFTVGGIMTKEVREKGERTGFEIVDVSSMKKGSLASKNQPYGPRVAKYRVNLKNLAEIGSTALENALESSDLIVCDEMGPLELFSPEFRRSVQKIISSSKPVLGSIHKRLVDPLVDGIKANPDVEVIEITEDNRDSVEKEFKDAILWRLRGS